MIWIIEYRDGRSISENEINFQFVDKKNIKYIYFLDKSNRRYGINCSNNTFFIDNQYYDFKINGEFEVVQYKNATISWNDSKEEKINSWNLGLNNLNEKYIMNINFNGNITITATKMDKIKTIQLR